jgi:broad specificity phosphatase PhoE
MKVLAQALRMLLEGKPLEAIYCSSLRRAKEGAGIIAQAWEAPVRISPSLRERHFGAWEGRSHEELRTEPQYQDWLKEPLGRTPPGGEPFETFRKRVLGAWRDITASHQEGNICIVAHGGTNRLILCHLLGLPLEKLFCLAQEPGCLNVLELEPQGMLLRHLNWRPLS